MVGDFWPWEFYVRVCSHQQLGNNPERESSLVWWGSAQVQHVPIILGGEPREIGGFRNVWYGLFTHMSLWQHDLSVKN